MELLKTQARKAGFARRKEAHGHGLSAAACARLIEVLRPYQGRAMSGYMPIRTEINPLAAMEEFARFGAVGVPVIQAPATPLLFHRWTPECELVAGPFGALVPAEAEIVVPEVMIVPLAAFDRAGRRIGYGGGFYDRTLELLRARGPVFAVGFAYGAQEAGEVPSEATDQPLDAIVTEAEVLRF